MNEPRPKIVIESRSQLVSALAEAAETEHNLMCLYLYAMFALKRSESEGISTEELAAIERWRKVILSICLEEMTHLCLVSNLLSAIGSTAHFLRPNFPATPGAYPAGIVVELAPFNMQTLEHFIYLEHPASIEMSDAESFKSSTEYHRFAPTGRLSSSSGDYETVGALYEAIRDALICLSNELGEKNLFCGSLDLQITQIDSPLRGLATIRDLKSALSAIDTIIAQGEGASTATDSHFKRFSGIKDEYEQLLKKNPSFEPGRPVARNPVMRMPVDPKTRVWVNHPISARYIDLANAFYNFMLKVLVQVYVVEERDPSEKRDLLEISFSLMHLMAIVGESLTLLPASDDHNCRAGMSFAMERSLTPLAKPTEFAILLERLEIYEEKIRELQRESNNHRFEQPVLDICTRSLSSILTGISALKERTAKLAKSREFQGAPGSVVPTAPQPKEKSEKASPTATSTHAPQSSKDVETAEGTHMTVQFCSRRCIHSRHCVTEAPTVFKANTPGEWIFPDQKSPEALAAIIRECPSGALSYKSKSALKDEVAPDVNVMRVSENGPYRFLSDLEIDGKPDGFRATLCRCGLSKNKPYCDHSHFDAGFKATGEPDLVSDTALKVRDGKLKINRLNDGPLSVEGNVEICASTGHVVLRTSSVKLCRCGHSKSKPICDGTHAVIGFKDSVTP